MSDDKKTIRIPESDFETAKSRKQQAGQTWAEYLTDEQRGAPDADALARALAAESEGGVSWDDLKNACAAAIREELTVGEMGQ